MEFTTKDLFSKHSYNEALKILHQWWKKRKKMKNKKMFRFYGVNGKNTFLEQYEKMDDVDKLMYFNFDWHVINTSDDWLSPFYQWVLDVWCWVQEGGA